MTFQVDVQICGVTFACLVLVLFTVGVSFESSSKQQTPLAVPIQAQYNGVFSKCFGVGHICLFICIYHWVSILKAFLFFPTKPFLHITSLLFPLFLCTICHVLVTHSCRLLIQFSEKLRVLGLMQWTPPGNAYTIK